jgi:hypothetical protein
MYYEIKIYKGNTVISYGVFPDLKQGIRFVLNRMHYIIKKDINDEMELLDSYCIINNYNYKIEIIN